MFLGVYRRIRYLPETELPKQAVNKGISVVLITILTAHALPAGVAIALISLNIHGYYIGGELAGPSGHDDIKLSGLQFAAKLHEITMLASLSVIVVDLVRQELVAGEGIPFGAVFGSLQFKDISYLYSKEFLGTLKANFDKRIVKARLVLVLIVGAILALTVGPSSAIAMRPRIDNWPAGGSDFYLNATKEEIWPSYLDGSTVSPLCTNITLGTTCISKDWQFAVYQLLSYWPQLNNRSTMPENLQLSSPKSLRQLLTRDTQGLYPEFETLATTQMSNLADPLAEIGRLWAIAAFELDQIAPKHHRRFMYRNDAIYSINNVYQPLTTAICMSQRWDPYLREMLRNNTVNVPIVSTLCDEIREMTKYVIPPEYSGMVTAFLDNSNTAPALQFVDLPIDDFGNNTVGALITFPPSWPGGSNFLTCAVDARWTKATIKSTRDVIKVVTGAPDSWLGGMCYDSPSITARSTWAQYLNPYIIDTNQTVFYSLVQSLGSLTEERSDDNGLVQSVMESILTMLITNGLSRTAADATVQGELNDCPENSCNQVCGKWCLDIMPEQGQEFGYGANIYNISGVPDVSKLSKFTVQVDVNGYAYNIRGSTMILSIIVLCCYCAMTIVHSVFLLVQRRSSTAWNTVSEVTALAMQSQPTKTLKNTCVGISTTEVFSNLVRVVKTGEGDHLELDFGDREESVRERLVEDEFYG